MRTTQHLSASIPHSPIPLSLSPRVSDISRHIQGGSSEDPHSIGCDALTLHGNSRHLRPRGTPRDSSHAQSPYSPRVVLGLANISSHRHTPQTPRSPCSPLHPARPPAPTHAHMHPHAPIHTHTPTHIHVHHRHPSKRSAPSTTFQPCTRKEKVRGWLREGPARRCRTLRTNAARHHARYKIVRLM